MGFFRKKEEEKEPEKPINPLNDGSSWRQFAARGNELIDTFDFVGATECWTEAIARYDGDRPKYFESFRENVLNIFMKHLKARARDGQVVPAHLLGELDEEVLLKQPEFADWKFTENVFYEVKTYLSECEGPEETVMTYASGSYAIVGMLRFEPDVDECLGKCRELVRLGKEASAQAGGFRRSEFKGRMKPKEAKTAADVFVEFYDSLGNRIEAAVSGLSAEEKKEIREKQIESCNDRLEHLSKALQIANTMVGSGTLSRHGKAKSRDEEMDLFVNELLFK